MKHFLTRLKQKCLQNSKWQTSRLSSSRNIWKYSSFTFSNTCLLFVCLWLIKLMWQSIKQAYEMDRSDLQNEYWIWSYKQLYEANLQYLKKNLLNLLFKNDSQLHVYMREKNRVSQLMLKERTREAASTSVTQPSCESLSFRQKEKQSLVAEICFALSLSFRTTSIYFHSIIYH